MVQQEKLYTLRLRTQPPVKNASPFGSIRAASEAGAGIFLRMEQVFSATRERVFELWSDPEAIKKWFITPDLHEWVATPTAQCSPGGQFNFIVRKNAQIFHLHGTYIEVKFPEKLSFIWQWDENTPIPGAPGKTTVSIDFCENQTDTNLVLTHAHFPNEDARSAHELGWKRCFDGLSKLLKIS